MKVLSILCSIPIFIATFLYMAANKLITLGTNFHIWCKTPAGLQFIEIKTQLDKMKALDSAKKKSAEIKTTMQDKNARLANIIKGEG